MLQMLNFSLLRSGLAVALLGLAPAAGAASAPLQAELDAAVAHYEAGRLTAAHQAFTALSRRGLPAADYNLAVMHLRCELPQPGAQGGRALAGDKAGAGRACRPTQSSLQRAEQLLLRSARAGFVTAQLMLARALETGDLGRRDLLQAHRWYEVAATGGSVDAQVAMATAHYLGRGAARDTVQAARWFRIAAQGGDVGAQYLVASMFEAGEGVERDLKEARYWYGVAARNGDNAAPSKVKELDARLGAPSVTAPP